MVAVKRPAPSEAAPAKKAQERKPLEEEDFPRGGGGGLSALQRRDLREEGAAEAARDFADDGGARKRRKREVWDALCTDTLRYPSMSPARAVLPIRRLLHIHVSSSVIALVNLYIYWCEKAHEGCVRVQDGEDLFFTREALQGKLPKYVELLRFKVRPSLSAATA